MLIVAGHIDVAPEDRDDVLAAGAAVVAAARVAPGCHAFSMTADLLEPGRIVVFERWDSRAAVETFRGSGPDGEQWAAVLAASVSEYEVTGERPLTG